MIVHPYIGSPYMYRHTNPHSIDFPILAHISPALSWKVGLVWWKMLALTMIAVEKKVIVLWVPVHQTSLEEGSGCGLLLAHVDLLGLSMSPKKLIGWSTVGVEILTIYKNDAYSSLCLENESLRILDGPAPWLSNSLSSTSWMIFFKSKQSSVSWPGALWGL